MLEEISQISLGFFLIAGFIYMIYAFNKRVQKKIFENYQKVTRKYPSLRYSKDEQGEFGRKNGHLLTGMIRERPFVSYTYTTGSGDSTTYWTKFELTHGLETDNYQLKLTGEHIFHKLGKKLNWVKEMELRVQDFDDRFLIQSQNESVTRAILNKRIRDKLMSFSRTYFGNLCITNQHITYQSPYHLTNDVTYENFLDAIEVADLIADELRRVNR